MSAVSTQEMVRPGECEDLYYYDAATSVKQCFATTQNTKFVQEFANKAGGSSVFTIPPQNGIQDVVLTFQMAQCPTVSATGDLALPQAWGYALIKQVSFRYGGSSQYFLSGDQILQNALRRQSSRSTVDDLVNLGGVYAINTAAGWGGSAQNAYVVLTLPHNIPTGVGKAHPFPTDLLTQQVQITVELNTPQSIAITPSSGGTTPASAANVSLNVANFQVQQVMLNNQGDALARRVDMSQNAYAYPCEFVQQVQRINLANSANPQSVVLTGFRSGEVKGIQMWLTNSNDTLSNVNYCPFRWYQPTNVEMSYAGDIYARYSLGVSQLFNLINGNKGSAFNGVYLTTASSATLAANTALNLWTELPFAQTFLDEDAHHVLVHGKPITNGIVNLMLQTPTAANTWVLNVSYVYNSTLLMSQGTADFVF